MVSPDDNLQVSQEGPCFMAWVANLSGVLFQNKDELPKPAPRSKINESSDNDLLNLPSVPSNNPSTSVNKSDDIDFDDLTRRFEELKKKKL